jgi:hypothetical protein
MGLAAQCGETHPCLSVMLMLAASCAAGTVRATVEDDAAVGTYEVRETGCLPRVGRGRRSLLAEAALEQRAESLASTFGIGGPWSRVKRRLVTYVPPVPTGEFGNPVAQLVLVVPDDLTLHRVRVRRADGRGLQPGLSFACNACGVFGQLRV